MVANWIQRRGTVQDLARTAEPEQRAEWRSGLAAERDKIQKEVLVQKQSLAWESWINGARANSKVETHLPASRRG